MAEINIDKTIYDGRPTNCDNRLLREVRTYDLLDKLEIDYKRVDHDATATIDACIEVEKLLDITICKNLFLCTANKSQFYLLMMPGSKPFKTKELSSQIGSSRLSFASPEYMLELLDIEPGAVSVLGLMNDKDCRVKLLVDRDLMSNEYVGCHPCVNTSSLKIRIGDLTEKFLPSVKHSAIIVDLVGDC